MADPLADVIGRAAHIWNANGLAQISFTREKYQAEAVRAAGYKSSEDIKHLLDAEAAAWETDDYQRFTAHYGPGAKEAIRRLRASLLGTTEEATTDDG